MSQVISQRPLTKQALIHISKHAVLAELTGSITSHSIQEAAETCLKYTHLSFNNRQKRPKLNPTKILSLFFI